MTLDPRSPVLVGVAAVTQRADDPREAREPFELMAAALAQAAEDAGAPRLLSDADSIRVPRGFWRYADPGRLVAERIGARRARTGLYELGILQQTLLSDACRAIAAGREDVALVTGGEARHREVSAGKRGVEAPETAQPGAAPDEHHEPQEPILAPLEIERGLVMAVRAFALMENALRFADGQGLAEHRDAVARLWAGMSEVAADNPHAWRRTPVSAEAVRDASGTNRMLAFPYTRLHSSDWNVDQAAGLILCSVAKARALGIPEARWVFPVAATEANHVVPVTARPELHRSPGIDVAGARALALAGVEAGGVEHLDLYSCFPAAVRMFARGLGLDLGPGGPADRPLTVTGGMAFAGGPLNNYVLQSTARMAEVLRADPGSRGLVTSVSGFLNKQGFGVWSTRPREGGFAFEDCTAEVARRGGERALVPDAEGEARIASYTVVFHGEAPLEGLAVCDLPGDRRTLAVCRDPDVLAAMTREEFCGRPATLARDGRLTPR